LMAYIEKIDLERLRPPWFPAIPMFYVWQEWKN